jgi:hypothetical protein
MQYHQHYYVKPLTTYEPNPSEYPKNHYLMNQKTPNNMHGSSVPRNGNN